ncbi:unnamed protein product [Meganyctiphanes norvegica]|uniref:Uncharacterized protein n=1 Tax=Meganyctiphanes norvegica TaxID=48144 RepID=A0AAV2Q7B9_MEGNR
MMSLAVVVATLVLGIFDIISAQQSNSACGSYAAVSQLPTVDSFGRISKLMEIGGMAALHSSATDLSSRTHKCGAVLFSDRYLLTAAHCMTGNEKLISITMGKDDLNDNPIPGPNTYGINKVYIHPSYGSGSVEYNDIAILETDRKVQFNKKIWPFCLPESNQVFNDYSLLNIAGWGKTEQSTKPSVIQETYVHLISKPRCESSWREHASADYDIITRSTYPQGLTKEILCAGRDGVDACEGDSGGPMSYQNSNGQVILVGIIAKRNGCPDYPVTPGFYANVANYIDWIYTTTGLPAGHTPRQPGDDPSLCDHIAASQCSISDVAKLCKKKCNVDIDECQQNNGDCDHNCHNIQGSYHCSCRDGFKLNLDGKTCQVLKLEVVLPSEEECEAPTSFNIIGGQATMPGEWPWLAAIGQKISEQRFNSICGGTLITKQHVMSAAHCFASPFRVIVRLGEYNVNRMDQYKPQDFDIVDQRMGDYNRNPQDQNDIVILKLDRSLDSFTDTIKVACLPHNLHNDKFVGEELIVVGWGRTNFRSAASVSPVPLKGIVPVVPIQTCKEKYKRVTNPNDQRIIDDKQLCAGTGVIDSCKGDSGGPIHYIDKKTGKFYVVGVVSYGPIRCGESSLPGVYTRIGYYLDWIKESIRQMN